MPADAKAAISLLHVGEVRRVGDIAPRRRDDQIGMPPKLGRSVGRALDLRDAAEDVQHPGENMNRPRRVLADHVEHGIAEPGVIGRGMDQHDPAVACDDARRKMARSDLAENVAEMVHDAAGGEGIVDARRQRSHRDLGELPHRVFEILVRRPAPAERERPGDGDPCALDVGRQKGDGIARRHVIAWTDAKGDGGAVLMGPVGEAVRVEGLKVAAGAYGNAEAPRFVLPDRRGAGGVRRSFRHGPAQVAMHRVHHGLDVDAGGDVMDEPHQRPDAQQREEDRTADGEVRNERGFLNGPHGSQHGQGVGEGPEKDAEHDLVAGVAREVAKQARTHLPGGERQGRDGDGERGAGHSDRRGRHRAEQRASALGTAGIAPIRIRRRRQIAGDARCLQPDRELTQSETGQNDQGRSKPELIPERLEPSAQT